MMQTTQKPTVSVIIPTYGRPDVLKKSIDSALKQNYPNLEVIVVDDNNPDTEGRYETEELMEDQYSNVSKVEYIKHEKNKNGSAARNTGFRNSKGSYVCFLDDDDSFLQGKVKQQVNFLEAHPKIGAVYCGYRAKGKNNYPKYKGDLSKELLLMDYNPVTTSLMFRRSVIEDMNGFDESFVRHQDYELMLRFFENHQVDFVDDILVDIGQNTGENIVRGEKLEELKKYFLTQFSDKIDELEKTEPGIRKKIYSRHYSKVFLTHINHGYYSNGIQIFMQNITRYPMIFTKDICIQVYDYFIKQ